MNRKMIKNYRNKYGNKIISNFGPENVNFSTFTNNSQDALNWGITNKKMMNMEVEQLRDKLLGIWLLKN